MRGRNSYLIVEMIFGTMLVLTALGLVLNRLNVAELEQIAKLWPVTLIAIGVDGLFTKN